MAREIRKWLVQAEADLKAAKDSLKDGHSDWCCFQCQQAAEKALKAFLYDKGYTSVLTHSLKQLVRECKRLEVSFREIEEPARLLDMFYVPTRYPNGLAGDIAPAEFYEKEDGERCLSYAESILNVVKRFLKP
jgi:HEPN domain-containing protein